MAKGSKGKFACAALVLVFALVAAGCTGIAAQGEAASTQAQQPRASIESTEAGGGKGMTEEEQAVLESYEAMQQAMVDKDVEAMRALTTEDKTFTHMSGKVQTREEFFGEIADGTLAAMYIDYAFWCTDGVYNMGNDEAAEAGRMVGAVHNVPYHNDTSNSGEMFDREAAEKFGLIENVTATLGPPSPSPCLRPQGAGMSSAAAVPEAPGMSSATAAPLLGLAPSCAALLHALISRFATSGMAFRQLLRTCPPPPPLM